MFCNISIQKFQSCSLRTMYMYMSFSNVYVVILDKLLIPKTLFSCFCCLLQTSTFQIISWWLRNTMRLDIPNTKIFTNAIKNLTWDVAYFPMKEFFFYGFLSSANFLFVSSRMFWCTLVFTSTDHILKHKNDVLKKTKLPKLYIC